MSDKEAAPEPTSRRLAAHETTARYHCMPTDTHEGEEEGLDRLKTYLRLPSPVEVLLTHCSSIKSLKRPTIEGTINGMPLITFEVADRKNGGLRTFFCNPCQFAVLRLVEFLGQTIFLNWTGPEPFLKICGQMKDSAGFTAARFLAGAEEGEVVTYKDGNHQNLTHVNLMLSSGNARRGRVEQYSELLWTAANGHVLSDASDKIAEAQALLSLAFECLENERVRALHAASA